MVYGDGAFKDPVAFYPTYEELKLSLVQWTILENSAFLSYL